MIRNYFNVAVRNLLKHRFYALINILGLSIGLTCFLLISLFVIDELSFDSFQKDIDRIHRMDFKGTLNGETFDTSLAGAPTAAAMVEDFPEVVDAIRFRGGWERLIKRKDENINFKQDNVAWVDRNFFEFFDLKLQKGNPSTVLDRPDGLVINESVAGKLFGDKDPIGEILILDNNNDKPYEITGVYEDFPANMHFHYEVLLSMEDREESKQKQWVGFNFNTYLKLAAGVNPDSLEAKFPQVVEKYLGPEFEQFLGQTMEELEAAGDYAGFSLFPMKDIHLHSDKLGEIEQNGSMQYVYIFSAIALFILVLACINFMNLSTAQSSNRAKEVGIRKTMGAYRQHLINQFLSEAFLITLISILLAYGITYVLVPNFNELANKEIAASSLFSLQFGLIMVGVLIIVGLFAGSYPAFYLSRFKPVDVIKGKLNLGMKSGGIRSVLVVFQFSISIIMMIGTVIVFNQLNYIQNKKLGYDKSQVLMIEDPWLLDTNTDAFKTEALRLPSVISGTLASFLPVGTTYNNDLWFKGKTAGQGDNFVISNFRIDHDYIETLGMEITQGRSFSREFPSDSSGVLINEAAARQFGFEDPVGEYIARYWGSREEPYSQPFKIVGVVRDFHYSTMRDNIGPLLFVLDRAQGFISFKIESDNISQTVSSLKELWNEMAPGQPFAYSFLDDRFNEMYEAEQRIGNIFSVFAFLAIFIACLGLYGLAAFTAEQKTKEIGIRKVLGASITQIIALLSKEFLKLVVISFLIGSAVSYFTMQEWLNDFKYRVNINPVSFVLVGATALAIAWLTMSFQSIKAARTNPVNSLKDE